MSPRSSPLSGRAGWGEVYRARDTRLKRDVALKILPESFTADPEPLARFQREAEVLASLNHPNIAAIYGLEESDGTRVHWSWSWPRDPRSPIGLRKARFPQITNHKSQGDANEGNHEAHEPC